MLAQHLGTNTSAEPRWRVLWCKEGPYFYLHYFLSNGGATDEMVDKSLFYEARDRFLPRDDDIRRFAPNLHEYEHHSLRDDEGRNRLFLKRLSKRLALSRASWALTFPSKLGTDVF